MLLYLKNVLKQEADTKGQTEQDDRYQAILYVTREFLHSVLLIMTNGVIIKLFQLRNGK